MHNCHSFRAESSFQVLAAMVALLQDRGVEAPEHSFATCLHAVFLNGASRGVQWAAGLY